MIQFSQHSGVYTLQSEQEVPISIEKAWSFFSSPNNLEKLTPSDLSFQITSTVDKRAYPGQIITYNIGIIPLIKSSWVTEITQVNEPHFFIDEQRFGPYSMWHHEHWFESTENGVKLKDKVTYKLPFGILGRMLHPIFIRRKLEGIFTFRQKKLNILFGS